MVQPDPYNLLYKLIILNKIFIKIILLLFKDYDKYPIILNMY
jgi:hypothetical protein